MLRGGAHVMYNMKMKVLMYDGQLDAAPAGKSYQLWVVPMNGNPISAGVFNPTQGQMDHWMMDMPEGMVPKALREVTIEPARWRHAAAHRPQSSRRRRLLNRKTTVEGRGL